MGVVGLPAEGNYVNLYREYGDLDMDESRYDVGMRVRREVLGDAHVDRAQARQTSLDADFQRLITEMAW